MVSGAQETEHIAADKRPLGFDAEPDALAAVEAIIRASGINQTLAPIDCPSGLPNQAYTDPAWFALEQSRIFARQWIFVGSDGELPEVGSIKPIEIAGQPIMLVRGEDQTVRAFHNVCRHRGTQLITEPCALRSVTCPYHAWNYRLDGRLRSRPHFRGPNQVERFSEEVNPELDLLPVRLSSWQGCLFVDLSGQAPDLSHWLAPMLARFGAYDFANIQWIGKDSFTIRANWKLVLENYMEPYHVFAAHPRLLAHAPMDVRWSGQWQDHVFYNDYVAPTLTEGRGAALPHYPNLSDEDTRRGAWTTCFPTFCVEVFADQFTVLVTYPIAPDETYEELHFFVVNEDAAHAPEHEEGRKGLLEMWHDLNLEDVAILERLQKGRKSAAFPGSLMSPAWETPSHQLSQKVLQAIVEP